MTRLPCCAPEIPGRHISPDPENCPKPYRLRLEPQPPAAHPEGARTARCSTASLETSTPVFFSLETAWFPEHARCGVCGSLMLEFSWRRDSVVQLSDSVAPRLSCPAIHLALKMLEL